MMNAPQPTQPHADCLPLTANIRGELTKRHAEQVWTIYRSMRRPMSESDLGNMIRCWNEILIQYT